MPLHPTESYRHTKRHLEASVQRKKKTQMATSTRFSTEHNIIMCSLTLVKKTLTEDFPITQTNDDDDDDDNDNSNTIMEISTTRKLSAVFCCVEAC